MNATRTAKARMLEHNISEEQVRSLLGLDEETRLGTQEVDDAVARQADASPSARVSNEQWKRIAFPVSMRPLSYQHEGETIVAPNRNAIVRDDTGDLLNVVSDRYKLVPHEVVFRPVAEAIAKLGLKTKREDAVISQGGGYARYTWTLDDGAQIATKKDDILWSVTARNSYNYESRMELEFGAFRLICSNGMRAPFIVDRLGGKHLTGLDVEGAIAEVESFLGERAEVTAEFKRWSETEVSRDRFEMELDEVQEISKKAREAILENFDEVETGRVGSTAWAAYNALTWYATHQVESRADRAGLVQDQLQERALQVVGRLVG